MPVPQFNGKHAGRPYVTPERLIAYRAEQGEELHTPPTTVIVSWQNSLLARVRATWKSREIPGPVGSVLELSPQLGFARVPLGAPVIAIVMEELAVQGVTTIVGVGAAGAIGTELEVGQVVVCSSALRDEGTSLHYSPDERWAQPDPGLIELLRAALPQARFGPSWTTDAPYRETAEEVVAYRREGILTVEMEASAMFTVGARLGIHTASVFCVSDVLHGSEWQPHFHAADVDEALWQLFHATQAALAGWQPIGERSPTRPSQ